MRQHASLLVPQAAIVGTTPGEPRDRRLGAAFVRGCGAGRSDESAHGQADGRRPRPTMPFRPLNTSTRSKPADANQRRTVSALCGRS